MMCFIQHHDERHIRRKLANLLIIAANPVDVIIFFWAVVECMLQKTEEEKLFRNHLTSIDAFGLLTVRPRKCKY